ncbi:heavy metal-binding domain-containing protein [Hymenobacter elongatus]|uniref:Heavy metal binding domain-containing protein n=1 Tax=Hymenobacter elongatus TaxID=877208 RepID=A0A4Z0PJK1_9BACT|nr:heavy metal-binding domain-containing protein [Hymenobacter elongatus]TGE14531.1 hypothetical protein E5J99_15840 [Hymenobacter elongatus]
MKFSQILLAAALLTAPFATSAQHSHKPGVAAHGHKAAGETHGHRAPHGGTVRTAGKFHIELVQHADEVHVYLLDGKEATVATQGTTGTITLLTTTGKTSRLALTPVADHFTAKVPAGMTVRTAIVSFNATGKSLSARFEKLDAAKAAQAKTMSYACPMNCEGSASNQPGSCPKCGMALVKKP